jgi:hypothetical protein
MRTQAEQANGDDEQKMIIGGSKGVDLYVCLLRLFKKILHGNIEKF